MKFSCTVSLMEAFFQISRFKTWQSKIEGSCTLTKIHFSSSLPSSRASSHDSGEMSSTGGLKSSARSVDLEDASDAPPVALARFCRCASGSASSQTETGFWLKMPGRSAEYCQCHSNRFVLYNILLRCLAIICSAMAARMSSGPPQSASGPTRVSVVRAMGALT